MARIRYYLHFSILLFAIPLYGMMGRVTKRQKHNQNILGQIKEICEKMSQCIAELEQRQQALHELGQAEFAQELAMLIAVSKNIKPENILSSKNQSRAKNYKKRSSHMIALSSRRNKPKQPCSVCPN